MRKGFKIIYKDCNGAYSTSYVNYVGAALAIAFKIFKKTKNIVTVEDVRGNIIKVYM